MKTLVRLTAFTYFLFFTSFTLAAGLVLSGQLAYHVPSWYLTSGRNSWRLDTDNFDTPAVEWLHHLIGQKIFVGGNGSDGAIEFARGAAGGILFRVQKTSIRFTPTCTVVEGPIDFSKKGFPPSMRISISASKSIDIQLLGPLSQSQRLKQFWEVHGGPQGKYFSVRGFLNSQEAMKVSYVTPSSDSKPTESRPVLVQGTVRRHPNPAWNEYVFQTITGDYYRVHPLEWKPEETIIKKAVLVETRHLPDNRLLLGSTNGTDRQHPLYQIGRLCLIESLF